MSLNDLSSDLPETLWWSTQLRQEQLGMEPIPNDFSASSNADPSWTPQLYQQHRALLKSRTSTPTTTPFGFNLKRDDNDDEFDDQIPENPSHQEAILEQDEEQQPAHETEREPMFEKPLTPSDVGKLNRLVIPKQHAEKYFPLSGESGLLLSFEDESGKCWRFRYSYWNSSQSYVLTKGWSRYVKEKRLEAGDIVLFERHRTEGERLFIGWRRRGAEAQVSSGGHGMEARHSNSSRSGPGYWTRVFHPAHPDPPHHHHNPLPYLPDCLHAGSTSHQRLIQTTVPVGSSRILRLFGVNLECQPEESEPSTSDGSPLSNQGSAFQHSYNYLHQPADSSSDAHDHSPMDFTFSRDANQMRNHRG